jgi:effector-binding domain-containing protein
MPTLEIERREVAPQTILFIRRRVAPSQLQATLGECLGKIFAYSSRAGVAIAGWPLCRYVSTGQGLWTIEPAMPIATPAVGEGEILSGILPGGPVAVGTHVGPLEDIPDSNAAIERWIEENGFKVSGATWEWYKTDAAKQPNAVDWRTEIYWPIDK